uniref:Malectin-like domain-containing protein n=1 Tax=Aegilops tauschii subsp. strangulata TaxID=200361 RepID=A0A452ZLN7_AEGTS
WQTVNVSTPGLEVTVEAIVVVPDDFVQVCLVNTRAGTPFVSALELRPLKMKFYPQANLTQGLLVEHRMNLGPADQTNIIRYPVDPYDRVWIPWADPKEWTEISTTRQVQSDDDDYEVPSAVMQTAVTPLNASKNLEISWDPVPQPRNPSPGYFIVMHFSELQILPSSAVRQFYVSINGMALNMTAAKLYYHGTAVISNVKPYRYDKFNISLHATTNSTLPPIINAIELFSVMPTSILGTDSQDVSATVAIKDKYHVQKNWMGDPCIPKTIAWERMMCSYTIAKTPRIISINLSFSGLNGYISSSFANLKALQYLYVQSSGSVLVFIW